MTKNDSFTGSQIQPPGIRMRQIDTVSHKLTDTATWNNNDTVSHTVSDAAIWYNMTQNNLVHVYTSMPWKVYTAVSTGVNVNRSHRLIYAAAALYADTQ